MYLGAHVSIAGGFDKSIERVVEIGGNCLMTFASSPRSLKFSTLDPKIIEKYLVKKQEHKIGPHFLHGIYLVNLATQDMEMLELSRQSLISYQQTAGEIGGIGTIFHVGSHKGLGLAKTLNQIVASINYILDSSPKGIKLILENSAGAAGTIGSTFADLGQIIERIGDKSKIGICLDTQHLFASGIPLKDGLDQLDKHIGIKHLSVIHYNDSKTDFGSNLDRHENLGVGKIGEPALKAFLSDSRLKDVPIILEVPGIGDGPTKKDVDTLKSFVG